MNKLPSLSNTGSFRVFRNALFRFHQALRCIQISTRFTLCLDLATRKYHSTR